MLNDGENGQSMAIGLFETEADYRQGDETLNAMDPRRDGMEWAAASQSRNTRSAPSSKPEAGQRIHLGRGPPEPRWPSSAKRA